MRPEKESLLLELYFFLCIQHMSTALNANYSVVQDSSEVVAIMGETITLKCAFSIQTEQAASDKGAMTWFRGPKEAESEVVSGHRFSLAYPKTFLSQGEGRLVITNVSLEDAGCYTCKVMVWGHGEKRGNGVKLHVYAHPSTPTIFLQLQSEPMSRWTLICRTSGFYPAEVCLTWYLDGHQLPCSQQNCTEPTGLLQASSLLDLPNPDHSAIYTCTVKHPSLPKALHVQYHYVPQHPASLPPSMIEVLNLMKIGTIFGIFTGFLTLGQPSWLIAMMIFITVFGRKRESVLRKRQMVLCVNCCQKESRKSPVGHGTQRQQILQSRPRNAFSGRRPV